MIARHSITLTAVTVCAVALAVACSDITAPVGRKIPSHAFPAAWLGTTSTVVHVTPDSMRGWSFYDDQASVTCADASVCQLVDGPGVLPGTSGSAELATTTASDGKALVLQQYAGTRLDRVSDLRYWTYRQSLDAGNNLAIALQLNVDYDLTDASTGYQGRLVYEPYQSGSGSVTRSIWQEWDTRQGKWWGTRATVTRGGVSVANPCVQAAPCTWVQLLALYPNIGIHSVYGAVLLKAGSGWAAFRGNVNLLTIGVDSVSTTFAFSAHALASVQWHLRAVLDSSVAGTSLPRDSTYADRSSVSYSYAARPGHMTPVVMLDDTLASLSGQILMDRDHSLEVVTDTIYTYAGLTSLEKSIADRLTAWLAAPDKIAAERGLIAYYLQLSSDGASSDALDAAQRVAAYVAIDPIRDAAALQQADDVLAGHSFYIDIYSDNTFGIYDAVAPVIPTVAASRIPLGAAGTGVGGRNDSVLPRRLRPVGPVTYVSRHAQVTEGAARSLDVSPGENPQESTHIVYTNGIWTPYGEPNTYGAAHSAQKLTQLVQQIPRFKKDWTTVVLHYNRTRSVQMQEYDRDHPCDFAAVRDVGFLKIPFALVRYALCKGTRFERRITSIDLIEAAAQRVQLALNLPPTNPDVDSLVHLIANLRNANNHVLLVGHSQGTLVDAQAIRALPAIEHHPLQVAHSCVAALALGPAASREHYPLDDYHVAGLLVEGDIIRTVFPTGWTSVTTARSQAAAPTIARSSDSLVAAFKYAKDLHDVDKTYFGELAPDVGAALVVLHRECVAQTATLTVPATVAVGDTFAIAASITNQNGRPLLGRYVHYSFDDQALALLDSVTFRAMAPREDPLPILGQISLNLSASAQLRVPLLSITANVTEKLTWRWDVVTGSNGADSTGAGYNTPKAGPAPTEGWDGDPGTCTKRLTVTGEGTSYLVYERYCGRTYHVQFTKPDTLASGRPVFNAEIVFGNQSTAAAGSEADVSCGLAKCVSPLFVRARDQYGKIVASSGAIAFP